MPNIELSFASGESSLSVRSFSVEQRMSGLFEIGVVATSPDEDLDLDALLGSGAVLRLGSTDAGATYRAWSGIIAHAEQVEIDAAFVSTYYLRLVPTLWRATRRRNNRIFQHKSLPEIALAVLADFQIEPVLELDLPSFPRHEYRVEYGESDFSFISRVLEEAGVAYCFRDPDPAIEGAQTALVLSTGAQANEARAEGPLVYVAGKDMAYPPNSIWGVRLSDEVRSGRITIRDYDFRSRPDFQLIAEARAASTLEERLEIYEYAPGAFLVEPEGGRARVDEKQAKVLAERQLAAARQGKRVVSFRTNALDIAPGTVFTITGHPRHELGEGKRLLCTHQSIAGATDGEWVIACHAVLADETYRPLVVTPRPRIPGLQSALVVGPHGEEIHTDEHGRVRVQFHWDREGKRDQHSSCFVRVSQAWAGRGFGVTALPRVGDEVLVGFFEGDPDQPVIVGRVHNSASRVPLGLPAQKTRTTWRSESTPGGGGWNEITFEDQKGHELVYVQAERDSERLVKQHESVTIGASLQTSIGAEETREIAEDQTLRVGGDRLVEVKGSETITVGESFRLDLGGGAAGISVTSDKRIILSTGEASIVLDGPNIFFDGAAALQLSAGELVSLSGGEVHVDGGPNVYLNAGSACVPGPIPFSTTKSALMQQDIEEDPEDAELDDLLSSPVEEPGAAPEAVKVPAHVEEQLKTARDKVLHGIAQIEAKVLDKVEMAKAKIKALGENLVPKVEKARAEINAQIEKLRAGIEKIKAEAAARINALKAELAKIEAQVKAKIDQVKAIIDRAKQAIDQVKERIAEATARVRKLIADTKARITELKDNVKARFDELRRKAIQVKNEAQHVVDEVKGAIEHAKQQWKQLVTDFKTGIEHAKKHIHDIIADLKNDNVSLKQRLKDAFGDAKELFGDAKADAAKVSADGKALVNDAKANAKQIAADAKETVADAKQLGKDAAADAKDTVAEAKQAWKDTAAEAKETAADLKSQAKGAAADAKEAWGDIKGQTKELFGGGSSEAAKQGANVGNLPVPVAPKGAVHATGAAASAGMPQGPSPLPIPAQGAGAPAAAAAAAHHATGGAAEQSAAAGAAVHAQKPESAIVTRSGAFGADGVAKAVNGTKGATFLQSPNEGQLMIVPTQAARPVAPHVLSAQVVDHQMSGMPSSDAFAAALKDHGYAVYERPWDSVSGEFLQTAAL